MKRYAVDLLRGTTYDLDGQERHHYGPHYFDSLEEAQRFADAHPNTATAVFDLEDLPF